MEAPQGVELTGTNRPSDLNTPTPLNRWWVKNLLRLRSLCGSRNTTGNNRIHPAQRVLLSVSVVIAVGKHPVPFRTRKLSPPAPMVLHRRRCGRVGHRRTQTYTGKRRRTHPQQGCGTSPLPFFHAQKQLPRRVHDDGDAHQAAERTEYIETIRTETVDDHPPGEGAGDEHPAISRKNAAEVRIRLKCGDESISPKCGYTSPDEQHAAVLAQSLPDEP